MALEEANLHTVDWIIFVGMLLISTAIGKFSFRGSVQAVAHLCIIGIIKANIKFGYNNGMAAFLQNFTEISVIVRIMLG